MSRYNNDSRRIPLLLLLVVVLIAALSSSSSSTVSAFNPSMPSSTSATPRTPSAAATVLNADADVDSVDNDRAPMQSEYGKSLELPETYASCGQCGSTYALTLEAMGPGSGGRYVQQHTDND